MTRPLTLLLAAASVCALDVAVDQGWGPTTSSHHLHAAGGAIMGAAGYAGLRVVGLDERASFIGSALAGSAVAVAYEIKNDRRGQDSFADPADALYTIGGVLLGAAFASLTEDGVEIALGRDRAAVSYAMRF